MIRSFSGCGSLLTTRPNERLYSIGKDGMNRNLGLYFKREGDLAFKDGLAGSEEDWLSRALPGTQEYVESSTRTIGAELS